MMMTKMWGWVEQDIRNIVTRYFMPIYYIGRYLGESTDKLSVAPAAVLSDRAKRRRLLATYAMLRGLYPDSTSANYRVWFNILMDLSDTISGQIRILNLLLILNLTVLGILYWNLPKVPGWFDHAMLSVLVAASLFTVCGG